MSSFPFTFWRVKLKDGSLDVSKNYKHESHLYKEVVKETFGGNWISSHIERTLPIPQSMMTFSLTAGFDLQSLSWHRSVGIWGTISLSYICLSYQIWQQVHVMGLIGHGIAVAGVPGGGPPLLWCPPCEISAQVSSIPLTILQVPQEQGSCNVSLAAVNILSCLCAFQSSFIYIYLQWLFLYVFIVFLF